MKKNWDSEFIFFDGDEYFNSVFNDIDNAKSYITIEMYIFNEDNIGKKMCAHLIAASQRGVRVQIIVDGIGSFSIFDKLYEVLVKRGVQIKIFNPLPFYHPYYGKLTLLKKMSIIGARLWRLNRRNHRKIITIDENILYTGSFNITAEPTKYFGDQSWKDMGVRVVGQNVRFAVLNFKKVWKIRDYFRYKKKLKKFEIPNWRIFPLRINQTLFMKRFLYKDFIQKINKSKERVWLMTPYFIPRRSLIRALGKSAARGVDVTLLISQKTDVKFFRWLQYFYYTYLLGKGVKIIQYTPSVLHAKNYIIDDFITIGSTNLNHRSLIHDLEADMVITDQTNKTNLLNHFEKSCFNQKKLSLEGLKHRPLWDRFLSRLFFIFKYWF